MSTTTDRLKIAASILNFEARRDNLGRLKVYNLPAGDGGGKYEVAGINERFHPVEAAHLRNLIENGDFNEAERYAGEYIASYTDAADRWTSHTSVESYLRDCVFNRGPGGAAKIYQIALGVKVDGGIGPISLGEAEKVDPVGFLPQLRDARERYEREWVGRDERSIFWKGLVNRWNNALTFAQGFLGAAPDSAAAGTGGPSGIPQGPQGTGGGGGYPQQVAIIAKQQYQQFHEFEEDDAPMSAQIRHYWEDIGFDFPGVTTPWSAVFVSWIMRQAGANASEFKASTAHSRFVFWAIHNKNNGTGLFWGHAIPNHPVKVGDIIQNNRGGQNLTYNFAAAHEAYQSHSAVVVELGSDGNGRYAITIGGNEANAVGRKRVALDSNGMVRQRDTNPYICVIENRKS
jgi:hypothetical protein